MRCEGVVRRIRRVNQGLLNSGGADLGLDAKASMDVRSTTEREPEDELLVELQRTPTMLT